MPANLNLDSYISTMKSQTTISGWFVAVTNLFKAAFQQTSTPFGDTAELDAAPGPNRVLVVGAEGKLPTETVSGQAINSDLPWKFNFEGEGTRLSTLKDFKMHVEGNKRWGEITQVMVPAPGGGTGGGDPGSGEPPFEDPVP